MGEPHRIGIIGLGVISRAYLETLARTDRVVITAVADLDQQRALDVASELPSARAMSVDELLSSDDVDTVLNLTIPAAHADIALRALENGKNTFGEKPLAITAADGRKMLVSAQKHFLKLGCAPDTVLGVGIQTSRRAIDEGVIGRPLAATATMVTPGHERWHPSPDFYYLAGGGPLYDMGPYYLTALVHLLGPITQVVALSSRPRTERTILTGPRAGNQILVEVDTHFGAVLEHESGALTTLTMSFDGVESAAPPIEVHGETGSLRVPDPNGFEGSVMVRSLESEGWRELPTSGGYVDAARGIGLLDFIAAQDNSEARAGGQLALHVISVMEAIVTAAAGGHRVPVADSTNRPSPVPLTDPTRWR